jgi:membrane-associated phospholipid phosphatase
MGESIPPNVLNAAALAQRDCFPSGHTEMTIISIYLSLKFKQSIRWIILIVGISLIIATVYLRYHYVIDIIAGIICAILVIFFAPYIQNWFDKFRVMKNEKN